MLYCIGNTSRLNIETNIDIVSKGLPVLVLKPNIEYTGERSIMYSIGIMKYPNNPKAQVAGVGKFKSLGQGRVLRIPH